MSNKILYAVIGCVSVFLISIGVLLLQQPSPPPEQPPQLDELQAQLDELREKYEMQEQMLRELKVPEQSQIVNPFKDSHIKTWREYLNEPRTDAFGRPLLPPPSSLEDNTQAQLDEYQARLDELEKQQKQQLKEQYLRLAEEYRRQADAAESERYALEWAKAEISFRDPLYDEYERQIGRLWDEQIRCLWEALHYEDLAAKIK